MAVHALVKRVIVAEFYRANAGFFLVMLGLVFGFLKAPEHLSLAAIMAHRPTYYFIPLGVGVLYQLKVLGFCSKNAQLNENQSLLQLNILGQNQVLKLFLRIELALYAPIWGYGLFLISVAIWYQLWWSALLAVLIQIIVIFPSALIIKTLYLQPKDVIQKQSSSRSFLRIPILRSTLFLLHLIQKHPLTLVTTKAFSLALLLGASILFQQSESDFRLLALGMLLAVGVNSIFAIYHLNFERGQLLLFNNLPLTSTKKFFDQFVSIIFVLLPEILLLFLNNLSLSPTLLSFLLGTSILAAGLLNLYLSLLYMKSTSMESFIKYPFLISAALFFVILDYTSPFLIGVVAGIIAFGLYTFFRPRFENLNMRN